MCPLHGQLHKLARVAVTLRGTYSTGILVSNSKFSVLIGWRPSVIIGAIDEETPYEDYSVAQ